VDVKNIQ